MILSSYKSREHLIKTGFSFFQFPNLAAFSEIQHGIFTRSGGFSKGYFQSLNVSFGVGDDENAVKQNRRLISRCMNDKPLIFAEQVHGTSIAQIRDASDAPQADAMITDAPGLMLVIQVADCQAVLLYDPVRRVVANIHSGWRGSICNIIAHAVGAMTRDYGCNPRDLVAGIGPSLGPCCAEFIHYKNEIPEILWKYKDSRDHFDFWQISRDQLSDAGVPAENISSSGLCTRCRTDLFFSYRGEKITGRFGAVISIK